jgi:hypothetical protein
VHPACRESNRFLLFWGSVYAFVCTSMSVFTVLRGPDPRDFFGCSVPFSLWFGCLFVCSLSYYTTEYMRCGHASILFPCRRLVPHVEVWPPAKNHPDEKRTLRSNARSAWEELETRRNRPPVSVIRGLCRPARGKSTGPKMT